MAISQDTLISSIKTIHLDEEIVRGGDSVSMIGQGNKVLFGTSRIVMGLLVIINAQLEIL